MIDRQFLHRLVQFFLKFTDEGIPPDARLVGEGIYQLAGHRVVLTDRLEAEERPQAVLPQVAQRGVDRDAVEPREERGLSLEAVDRLERLYEGGLRQVRGLLAIRGHG